MAGGGYEVDSEGVHDGGGGVTVTGKHNNRWGYTRHTMAVS